MIKKHDKEITPEGVALIDEHGGDMVTATVTILNEKEL